MNEVHVNTLCDGELICSDDYKTSYDYRLSLTSLYINITELHALPY